MHISTVRRYEEIDEPQVSGKKDRSGASGGVDAAFAAVFAQVQQTSKPVETPVETGGGEVAAVDAGVDSPPLAEAGATAKGETATAPDSDGAIASQKHVVPDKPVASRASYAVVEVTVQEPVVSSDVAAASLASEPVELPVITNGESIDVSASIPKVQGQTPPAVAAETAPTTASAVQTQAPAKGGAETVVKTVDSLPLSDLNGTIESVSVVKVDQPQAQPQFQQQAVPMISAPAVAQSLVSQVKRVVDKITDATPGSKPVEANQSSLVKATDSKAELPKMAAPEVDLPEEPAAVTNGKAIPTDLAEPDSDIEKVVADHPVKSKTAESSNVAVTAATENHSAQQTGAVVRHVTEFVSSDGTVRVTQTAELHRSGGMDAPRQEVVVERVPLQALPEQTLRGVRYLMSNDEQSMRVRLVPESLGEVRMEVLTTKGHVTVRLASADAGVRELLHTQAQGLRDTLSQDGTHSVRVTITQDMTSGWSSNTSRHGSSQHGPQGNHPSSAAYGQAKEQTPSAPRERATHKGLLNIYA